MKTEAITIAESKRLIELEALIAKGKQTFVEVGLALTQIRDCRLYRSDFDTFEAYCKKRWGFSRQYAHQIISGVAAVKALPPNLSTMVDTERQARALSKVPPAKRAEVLEKAAASGSVTAKSIKAAATPDDDFNPFEDNEHECDRKENATNQESEPPRVTSGQPRQEKPGKTTADGLGQGGKTRPLTKLAQQVRDELDVAIEVLTEVQEMYLDAANVDADALNQAAEELSRCVKLLHRLAKEAA